VPARANLTSFRAATGSAGIALLSPRPFSLPDWGVHPPARLGSEEGERAGKCRSDGM
jgi:hypothetical protein